MEHVAGRIFKDPMCPELSNEERSDIYHAMNDVLTKIHNVDLKAANLEDYGKHSQSTYQYQLFNTSFHNLIIVEIIGMTIYNISNLFIIL